MPRPNAYRFIRCCEHRGHLVHPESDPLPVVKVVDMAAIREKASPCIRLFDPTVVANDDDDDDSPSRVRVDTNVSSVGVMRRVSSSFEELVASTALFVVTFLFVVGPVVAACRSKQFANILVYSKYSLSS
jgi:hypothetical protein